MNNSINSNKHHNTTAVENPIGIFDSGMGGLSIESAVSRLLPSEHLIYIADNGFAPYGDKPPSYIEARTHALTQHLVDAGAKIIVVACNTATASVINHLRQDYQVPFIGVEPGIKPAAKTSSNGKIGVLATTHTLASDRYQKLKQQLLNSATVIDQACPGLAGLIEQGKALSTETDQLLRTYLAPLMDRQIDTLVLGCTHYSFLSPVFDSLSATR